MLNQKELGQHQLANRWQTFALLAVMSFLMGYLAYLLVGPATAVVAAAAVLFIYISNPTGSPHLVLRMYKARLLPEYEAPQIYAMTRELARRAKLPRVPRLYLMPTQLMNAFAVGQEEEASIALSVGMVRQLTANELAGVIAHELSHIQHNDIRVMTFAQLLTRLTRAMSTVGQFLLFINLPLVLMGQFFISWWAILVMIAAPTLITLVQLSLSRVREFNADLGAARLLGRPEPLASALVKMERYNGSMWPALLGRGNGAAAMLSTHPPTKERVARLRSISERSFGLPSWQPTPLSPFI